jgi:hypothetical protein
MDSPRKERTIRRAARARRVKHKSRRYEFYAVVQQEGGVDFEVIPTYIIQRQPISPNSRSLAHREGLGCAVTPTVKYVEHGAMMQYACSEGPRLSQYSHVLRFALGRASRENSLYMFLSSAVGSSEDKGCAHWA